MKHESVRECETEETRMFDEIDVAESLPDSVYKLRESIIDLRDLQCALRDVCRGIMFWSNDETSANDVLEYSASACAHYLNIMHESDSQSLAPQIPLLLREGIDLQDLCKSLHKICEIIDTMCKVNAAVISMVLRGVKRKKA